jgi:putative ABC transport system permease protein
MFKSYLKITFRKIVKHKGYTCINVAGLGIGLASSFLIALFVKDELAYDRYHEHSDRIYRLVSSSPLSPQGGAALTVSEHVAHVLRDLSHFGGIVAGTRIKPSKGLVHYRDKRFNEDRFFFADTSVFNVFTFPLRIGDSGTALARPNTLVMTDDMAEKYFGEENPIGKVLTFDDSLDFEVTGVLEDIPRNSHFRFDFLASFARIEKSAYSSYAYLLLDAHTSSAEIEQRLPAIFKKYGDYTPSEGFGFHLQPLTKIHLHSHLEWEIEPNGEIGYIYVFSIIAVLLLLIACINFINLATARFTEHAHEVGMRKVIGAGKPGLVIRFLAESLILSMTALAVALALVECILPFFNHLLDKALAIRFDADLLMLVGVFASLGVIAGLYPAVLFSQFHPIQVLKGEYSSGYSGRTLTKSLVVFQFAVTVVLMIGTLVVHGQLNYVRQRHLGFNKEQVVVLSIRDKNAQRQYHTLKNELLQHADVINAAASSTVPGRVGEAYLPQWLYSLPGAKDEVQEGSQVNTLFVDADFLQTMEIELAAGRIFSAQPGGGATDAAGALILNEAAVTKYGWNSPADAVGRVVRYWQRGFKDAVVIGVVNNFNYASLHRQVEPLIIRHLNPNDPVYPLHFSGPGVIAARIRPSNIPATMAFLRSKWHQFNPNYPFEYFFLDENFNNLYRADRKLGQIFGIFAALAIFIASLGLLGLAAFAAERRTKEIGIRKVLGATVTSVIALLSKDFVKLVLLANLVAWPVAYFAMHQWLQNFAYRIDIGWWVFALAGGLALVIALLTVSTQALKAATVNPVDSLRYE